MVGGTVDLDGKDAVGDFVNVDAPFIDQRGDLSNFGAPMAAVGSTRSTSTTVWARAY